MLRSFAPIPLYALLGLAALGLAEVQDGAAPKERATASVELPAGTDAAVRELEAAARALLDALEEPEREKAALDFDADVRADWHYVPKERAGVRLGDLDDAQRRRVRALVRAALSSRGALKVQGVFLLEEVLFELERQRGRDGAWRDPGNYTLAVFGEPGDGPWGWRLEGHHLSLNVTVAGTELGVASTPLFVGANPGEVQSGPRAGLALLAEEAGLGRALMASLDAEQRARAVIAERVPGDVVMGPGRDAPEPAGLAASAMTADQRARMWRIVESYARLLRPELAERELARIRAAGVETIRFAWAGATPGESAAAPGPCYWRLHGPTFVLEYDDPYDPPGHAHTLWRDPARDFGADLLRAHREREHGGR